VDCPLAPVGSASYPVPVRRPAPLAPRFLRTLPRGHALALRSGRCDLLPPGLSPGSRCPCWAHSRSAPLPERRAGAGYDVLQRPSATGRDDRLLLPSADLHRAAERLTGHRPSPLT